MAPVEIRSHAGLSVCLIVRAQLCDFTKCSPLSSDMSLSQARSELELVESFSFWYSNWLFCVVIWWSKWWGAVIWNSFVCLLYNKELIAILPRQVTRGCEHYTSKKVYELRDNVRHWEACVFCRQCFSLIAIVSAYTVTRCSECEAEDRVTQEERCWWESRRAGQLWHVGLHGSLVLSSPSMDGWPGPMGRDIALVQQVQ